VYSESSVVVNLDLEESITQVSKVVT